MSKSKEYDPCDNEPLEFLDANGLTIQQKEDLRMQARILNTIFVYKMENGVILPNIKETKKAREEFIKSKGLKITCEDLKKAKYGEPKEIMVEFYSKGFEIDYDELEIPVYRLKQTIQTASQ
jgi:hypothetical protein